MVESEVSATSRPTNAEVRMPNAAKAVAVRRGRIGCARFPEDRDFELARCSEPGAEIRPKGDAELGTVWVRPRKASRTAAGVGAGGAAEPQAQYLAHLVLVSSSL